VIGTDCTGTKQKQKYNIGVLTVNIEFLWRGLDTGERQAFNQFFQPFRAEPHKFYIYRQYINIVKLLSHTPVIITLFTLA
jgi:hypothetical protein